MQFAEDSAQRPLMLARETWRKAKIPQRAPPVGTPGAEESLIWFGLARAHFSTIVPDLD